jgi:thymidylate kinase
MDETSMIALDREAPLTEKQKSSGRASVLGLVVKLCHALAMEKIDYCHWKSNEALDRSACGENDLDLLISRADAAHFTEILYRLGFKEALAPEEDELPGVRSYYGYDRKSGQLVHVHVHYQLVLGNDLSKNYRLPLERAYLESAVQHGLFRVPTPEFELLVFAIRMILKHSTWDSFLMRHGQFAKSERCEFDALTTPETVGKAHTLLCHVPGLSHQLFDECLQALRPGCSIWTRIRVGGQLQNVLQASARRPHAADVILKFKGRIWQPIRQRVFRHKPKHQMATGGLFIAIVGGDGAGKTTVVNELFNWLGAKFDVTKVHLGKPNWSWMTTAIRAFLKIGTLLRLYPFEGDLYEEADQPHGLPWFIRSVCTARDRYLTYIRARRLSSNGSLILCDRFSFPGFMQMDGPQCEQALTALKKVSWLHKRLAKWEASYYEQIQLPDLLIVLKLQPELAVQRKKEETEKSVHARSSEVWELDWTKKSACVIDASLPQKDVMARAQALVWEHL